MYYYLTSAIKRRAILELKDSFARHPIYQKVVPFIQNKFAFDERPQIGIVVKGSSANKVSLSSDNFIGNVTSYVMLAYVGAPTYPIEWVREDLNTIRANGGKMPTDPGIYYIEILTVPTNPQECGSFVIDPLLTVTEEPLLRFQSGIEREAQLENPPTKGTLRLWVNGRLMLVEGSDFVCNYHTGAITFLTRFSRDEVVTADYRYPIPSQGPFEFKWNTAEFKAIPGVVLAFGKRAQVGDKVAVRVSGDREDTALAYGGKFEVSLDLNVLSQDTTSTEEVADLVVMYLWGEKKPVLEFEGIEILEISIGGEAEETYDETADIFYYTANLTLQFRADWEIHVPLPLTVSKVTAVTPEGSNRIVPMTGSLFFATFPAIVGRNNDYERIT